MGMLKDFFLLVGDKNRRKLKIIFLLMTLRGVARIIPLLFLYHIILELLGASVNLWRVWELTAMLTATYIGFSIWDHYLDMLTMIYGHRTSYDVRMRLGDKLRKLSLGFFARKQTGELNTILSEYVSRAEQFISYSAPFMFSSFAAASALTVFFLFLDWRLALATAAVTPLVAISFVYADRIAERTTRVREASLRKMNSLVVEFIQGIPVIKIFNQTASNFSRFKSAMSDFREKNIQAVASATIPGIILLTSTSLSIVILLPVGLYLYFNGALPLTTLAFFIIAAPTFSDMVAHFLFGYIHTKNPIGQAMQQISQILKEKTLPEPEKDSEILKFDIEFRDVSFSYNGENALKNVSFEIQEKSITAIVGPSGAGKTTIANLLARFWDVKSGEIRLGGQDIREMKLDQLLSYISIVFQEVVLFNDTIAENIRLGRKDATDEEVIAVAEAARCHEFAEKLPEKYNTAIGEKGVKLSAGERQRIQIARAILKNAPILIFDEASVYIDPENENLIQAAVNNLIKDKTVIVIAHRLSTITNADQILVVEHGRIAEKGNHQQLLAKDEIYSRLWAAHKLAQGWKIKRTEVRP